MVLSMTPFSLTPVMDKFMRYLNKQRNDKGRYNTNLFVVIDTNIVTIKTCNDETVLVTPIERIVKEANKISKTNLGPVHAALNMAENAVARVNEASVPSHIFRGNPLSIISAILSGDIQRPIRKQQENTY